MTVNRGEQLSVKQHTDIRDSLLLQLSFESLELGRSLKQSKRATRAHILAVLLLSCGSLHLAELHHAASWV